MARKFFKTYARKLTPSGLGDNGIYIVEGEVSIPSEMLREQGIVHKKTVKTGEEGGGMRPKPIKSDAWKVTIGNQSWLLAEDPLK